MWKKKLWLSALCILIALALSGCWHEVYEFYHFPDGSGRVVYETVITDEVLTLDEQYSTMEELRYELLEEFSMEDTFSEVHPNVSAVSREDFIDPGTGSFHYVTEVDVINMLEPFFVDEDVENFTFAANPDGSYRFSVDLNLTAEAMLGDDLIDPEALKSEMGNSDFTFKLFIYELIEADSRAVYDPVEQSVTWVIPMVDILLMEADYGLWAVYRVDVPQIIEEEPEIVVPEPDTGEVVVDPGSPQVPLPLPAVVQPPQDDGFLGLPNWVPFILAGVCCLSLIAVVVVILVVVVLKKRKTPVPPPKQF